MALKAKHKETTFGVGDTVRVIQKIIEKEKSRTQAFEGVVIAIKGRGMGKTFTVRRIGVQQIGIERIFPIASPFIEKVEVVRHGMRGVRRAKLYYTRSKSRKEIEKIYSRASKKSKSKSAKKTAKN
jgi:large subunit ribosomal protein L19